MPGVWITIFALGFSACAPHADSEPNPPDPLAERDDGRAPDDAWLVALGTGPERMAEVCARGAGDHVATALCANPSNIRGLLDVYAALGLAAAPERLVAATTHSLGLAARVVSAANPRVFVFNADGAPVPWDRFGVVAFSRGEQLVELVGLDPATLEYNFYLLRFEQPCNETRCTPADLLTERIESDWTGFSLYADVDLEDTPFDCVSCHRPFGPGTPKQLLMRQTASPWMHWGDFRGAEANQLCPDAQWPAPGPWIPGEGLDLLAELEGSEGNYAAVPVSELLEAPSGERFALFLTDAENTLRSTRQPSDYPYAQLDFGSTEALCERLATGTSPTWERQREESLTRGLPVPYYAEDVLAPDTRAEVLASRALYLERRAGEAAVDVAMGLFDPEAASAVGFVPRETDPARVILRELCVRCHSSTTDPTLARARFDAERLGSLEPAVAQAIRRRIALSPTAPGLMPPRRTGELPAWALGRIDDFLSEHEL